MAIAHVCLGCGLDLARVRAVVEPIYRLPLVTCPRCRQAVVRRTHPQWRAWRSAIRISSSLVVLAWKIVISMAIAGLTIKTAGDDLASLILEFQRIVPDAWGIPVASVLVVSLLNGVWVTATLGHLSKRLAWAGWFMFIAALIGIITGMAEIFDTTHRGWQSPALEALGAISLVGGMLVLGLAGIPLGNLVRQAILARRQIRWRRRRARRRARWSGG
jgi:hypothetical protein